MSRKKTHKEVIADFIACHGEGRYKYDLVEYKSNHEKVQIICNECNHQWGQTPAKHKNSRGCPKCAEKARDAHRRSSGHTTASWIKDAVALHGNRYDYSQAVYKGHDKPIKIICSEHGAQELPQAYLHLSKNQMRGCPLCSSTVSKGAASVARALDELNIEYIKEWKDHDCRDIKKLRFDYYLPDLQIVIEYDGDQHFKPGHWSTDEEESKFQFLMLRRRDAIKSQYCKDHNISLLRVTKEIEDEDMVEYLDYRLELYSDRPKIDIRYVPEDADFIKEVGMEQYLKEIIELADLVRDHRKKNAH